MFVGMFRAGARVGVLREGSLNCRMPKPSQVTDALPQSLVNVSTSLLMKEVSPIVELHACCGGISDGSAIFFAR